MNNTAQHPLTLDDKLDLAEPPRDFDLPMEVSGNFADLYRRYVTSLALLCECARYVDELDYVDLIEAVLKDASSNYPLDFRRCDGSIEIALRSSSS